MKTRNLAVLLLACIVAGIIAAFMVSVRGLLPDIAAKFLIILVVLLALIALWAITWLAMGIFKHLGEIHTAVIAGQARRYELTERAARFELERQERLAAVHVLLSRVQPGTYLVNPTQTVLPSAQDVILLPPAAARQIAGPGAGQGATPSRQDGLPTEVMYEEIRGQIPAGHILVGIGRQGVETKIKAVGACTWIVGLSGTGKTSTTTLRVEERAADNHVFLGVDPHWFKDDSLFHAIYETLDGAPGPYASRFITPMAKTPEESLQVLKMFLGEFNARKSGQRSKPWRRVTLLVDEVGAMMDKATATTPEEKEIIELLPSIARICGQESRNFEMGGIFISQQATGLAWLRKVALMVIVHQLLQESEKKLATNDDPDVMKAMKNWPIGRTYVYGVGFGTEGPRTVQQPYFKPGGYDAGEKLVPDEDYERYIDDDTEMEDLYHQGDDTTEQGPVTGPDTRRTTGDLVLSTEIRAALEAWNNGAQGPRALQRALGCTYYQAGELCKELKRRRLVEN